MHRDSIRPSLLYLRFCLVWTRHIYDSASSSCSHILLHFVIGFIVAGTCELLVEIFTNISNLQIIEGNSCKTSLNYIFHGNCIIRLNLERFGTSWNVHVHAEPFFVFYFLNFIHCQISNHFFQVLHQ